MTQSPKRPSVLFVCMGNICRSPSAEGFFLRHLDRNGMGGTVITDSAGTHSYHLGQPPDSRAISMAAEFGVDIAGLRARRIQADDFHDFDLIIGMDETNLRGINQAAGNEPGDARLELMMTYASRYPGLTEVPDPYYGDLRDFRYMCELLDDATSGLLAHLRDRQREQDEQGA